MNKKGFIENWGAFAMLGALGLAVVTVMLFAWKKMDFQVPTVTKILIYAGTLIAAFLITKFYLDD